MEHRPTDEATPGWQPMASFRMSDEQFAALDRMAQRRGLRRSAAIREAIDRWLAESDKEAAAS